MSTVNDRCCLLYRRREPRFSPPITGVSPNHLAACISIPVAEDTIVTEMIQITQRRRPRPPRSFPAVFFLAKFRPTGVPITTSICPVLFSILLRVDRYPCRRLWSRESPLPDPATPPFSAFSDRFRPPLSP